MEDSDQAAEVVLSLWRELWPRAMGRDWAVLAPMRRGSAGVNNLNEQLRELVNPAAPGKPELWNFRIRDRVMVIKTTMA